MHTPATEQNGLGATAKDVAEHASSLFRLELELATLELKKKAIELGMITLRRSGLIKVALGQTTMEEVLRETVL